VESDFRSLRVDHGLLLLVCKLSIFITKARNYENMKKSSSFRAFTISWFRDFFVFFKKAQAYRTAFAGETNETHFETGYRRSDFPIFFFHSG